MQQQPRRPKASMCVSMVLTLLTALLVPVVTATSASAATLRAIVNMPFTGQWAFNALVNPPYNDINSSYPSVHAKYYGDWATDLYAGAGTEVKLNVTSPDGPVTFSYNRSNDTCSSAGANVAGRGVVLNVLVSGVTVGSIDYEHLDNISTGPYTNGMTIGKITSEPLANSPTFCYTVRHAHVELKNASGSTYSCWVDKGNPGVSVAAGDPIGVLGSANNGSRQACSGVPTSGSVPAGNGTQLLGDVDGDNKADAVVYFASTGDWYVASSATPGGRWVSGHGVGSSKQFLADVNGDGKADAVAFFPSTGQWYVANSVGTGFGGYYLWLTGHGAGSSSQLLADVSGDGKADATAYFGSTGDWYVASSSSPSGKWIAGHGAGSSKQFLADVSGDGKADAVVYFPSSGQWYVANSTGSGFGGYYLWLNGHGAGSNNQLLANVDGDNKADAVVYFGGTGAWYVAPSASAGGQWINGHGAGSSNQLLADISGDGKADAVAFFGQQGNWNVAPSTGTSFAGAYSWLTGHGAGSA